MLNVICRQATISEFQEVWHYSNSYTYKYFLNKLERNEIEFWTLEYDKLLIGELYIFWDSEDKTEANGINRAYLCAFRIQKRYQGKGFGSLLMNTVIKRIKSKEYTEITIGIDNFEYEKLSSMYNSWGFLEKVKSTYIDLHYFDKNNKPINYNKPYDIFVKYI